MSIAKQTLLLNVRVPSTLYQPQSNSEVIHHDECLYGDLLLEEGRVIGFVDASEIDPKSTIPKLDLNNKMILPRFTEVHVHLDKCHTINRLGVVGGDLMQAIEVMQQDKHNWTATDLKARAEQALNELYTAGCQAVRTHIDWGDAEQVPAAWPVMHTLSRQWQNKLILQVAALTSLELFEDIQKAEKVVARIAKDKGVLGVFVLYQDSKQAELKAVFQLAKKYQIMLDFHVDEGLDTGLNGIQLIAEAAIENQFELPILCGHVCSLINYHDEKLKHVFDLIKRANITVATLPSTNLYLQGRQSGTPSGTPSVTPMQRGITRAKELQAAGINLVVGSDNVEDAFCPIGQHSPLYALSLAVMAGHLDPPLARWLDCISNGASSALGLEPTYVMTASVEQLLIANCFGLASLVSGSAPPQSLSGFLSELENKI